MIVGKKCGLEPMVSSGNKYDQPAIIGLDLNFITVLNYYQIKAKIKGTLSKEKGYCQVIIACCFF